MEDYREIERETFTNKEGEEVSFKVEWGGHKFTKSELKALKNGEQITLENMTTKMGKKYTAKGGLQEQDYLGNIFWGFKMWDYIPEDED